MKYRDLIKMMREDGWYEVRSNGSHHIFQHPTKPNSIPVPYSNPGQDVPMGLKSAI